jgi:uncharacterized repeat protein (TIGR04042 family)
MPEMTFHVRWPDGVEEHCYSPSLVMHDFLEVGASYPVEEFVARTTRALDIASDRVAARYGMRCTSAAEQQADIARAAARSGPGRVTVLALVPPPPATTPPTGSRVSSVSTFRTEQEVLS